MASISFLKKLGLYIDENFLSDKECFRICQEMEQAQQSKDGIWSNQKENKYYDANTRKSNTCHVSDLTRGPIEAKLIRSKKAIESTFGNTYSRKLERPKFVRYSTGDFFAPHTDDQLNREINMTIYLNASQSANGYSGGSLTLYDLIKSKGWEGRGLSIPSKTGMLIAYPTEIEHEVTPIFSGYRYAVVSRYLSIDA